MEGEKMIRIENVSKTFQDNAAPIEAVKNVSLEVEKGEIFGIIGYSGAGKSTLIRCINLLERPDCGKVIVDGVDLMQLKKDELREYRKHIGMIFQHFNLMPSRTVFENVAYSLAYTHTKKSEINERVMYLLELVGIADKANVYPRQLSGGQKQRVAIARALVNNPKVLLCDEATSALDPQMTQSILNLLKELNKILELTIVVITHEMAVVKELCNRVAVMQNGEIVEQGDIFKVFSNPRQAITREFINTTSSLNKIYDLVEKKSTAVYTKPGEKIIIMRYKGKYFSEPLVAELATKYRVTANILYGDLVVVDNAPLGGIVAIMSGEEADLEKAYAFLAEKEVELEVIKE